MKHVLLVDDDPVWNLINRRNLEITGMVKDIDIASNGQEALTILEKCCLTDGKIPDVILLDINMPILNGFGFLEGFKKMKCPDKHMIKISILSSSENEYDLAKARELGVSRYFVKPLDPASFLSLLK
ncbi:response regulator [soil metagenome]